VPDLSERLRIEEYRALRATIRQRGSIRFVLTAVTFSVWGAALLTVLALSTLPFAGLVPLVILAAGFETIFALHVGVERIGRYIQVHYEQTDDELASTSGAHWEHTAMRFAAPGGGTHALVPLLFVVAGLLNLALGTLLTLDVGEGAIVPLPFVETLPYVGVHALFVARVFIATRYAAGQRARDLREFERLHSKN
jgi:hypothetical protein